MNVSFSQATAALDAQSRWQELIAENLAASSVPGFKKHEISFAAVEAGLKQSAAGGAGTFLMPQPEFGTNFQAGPIRPTGVKTDLAIDGPGFFTVQLPDGSTAYTRAGEFHIDAEGQLVTKSGYAVLSDGGPLQLDPKNSSPLSIASNGKVSQGSDPVGTLRLVEFKDPKVLTPLSGSYFKTASADVQGESATKSSLQQGYLEGSNASPVAEMANLIAAMRLFEANQRVLQSQDERMGKAISELGSLNG